MTRFELEYCYDCMFLGRAIEVASAILTQYQNRTDSFELIPGHDGIFTVRLDGQSIYEIAKTGIPAKPDDIVLLVNERLG